MKKRHLSLFICSIIGSMLGCTSLESRMTIEPYTKNTQMRNALEQIASGYCEKMRTDLDTSKPVKQPDFIFTSDGCTRWPNDSWLSCCIVHDITYWCGGSEQDRKDADQDFKQCVNKKMQVMGDVMYSGVRIGGSPWLPTPWRWGYGWKHWPNGYEQLNDTASVKKLLDMLKIHDLVEQHLLNNDEGYGATQRE